MRTSDLDYDLPPELVATHPAQPRDAARLMVVDRARDTVVHAHVRDLPGFLRAGDALVLNTTAVMPARFVVRRASGAILEGLAIEPAGDDDERTWRCMVRGAARLRPGEALGLVRPDGTAPSGAETTVIVVGRDGDTVRLRFAEAAPRILAREGRTPLPPYILRARAQRGEVRRGALALEDERADGNRYQTIYADSRQRRSVAAPTAGLHMTPGLMQRLDAAGVGRVDLVLHVGPGTFKPVETERLEDHPMHREWWSVPAESVQALAETRRRGGRIVAVGTTSVRTLESLPGEVTALAGGGALHGSTDILIAPGHVFRHVDALLTNLHLPRSTLLALVAALVGPERLRALYAEAVAQRYRFYSYGDAMLIV